jgi:hypothetical protein
MLRAPFILILLLQACASTPEPAPNALTFRRAQAIEFYDLRLNASHDGGERAVTGRDCSSDRFHCYAGLTLLMAPRECRDVRRLLRERTDWIIEDRARARFLFRSEEQYFYASEAGGRANTPSGFVYDIERGVIGVWRSDAAQGELDRAAAYAIIDSTKWLEAPRALFACD